MRDDVRDALRVDASADMSERTIDITTTGRQSGETRRIETVFHRVAGEIYLSGLPAPRPRAWLLNLQSDPHFVFHLKAGVAADLAATATVITDPDERRRILGPIVESLDAQHVPDSPFPARTLDEWVAGSPLVRVGFEDA